MTNPAPPINTLSFAKLDENGNVREIKMHQPLVLSPYGFMEKLWPSNTTFKNVTNEYEAAIACNAQLQNAPVTLTAGSNSTKYDTYTLDESAFKQKHISKSRGHIVIPSEALHDRRLICLWHEGGLYQKATTGSFDTIRWFILLASSRGPHLLPVEIMLHPNAVYPITANLTTRSVHELKKWYLEFEDPKPIRTYIETYTEYVGEVIEHHRGTL
jgi:hypothetical protein